MEIGAQFYTIREFCKTLEDTSESLKKIADIGYKNVQLSGVCPYEPEWMKEELDKNGLKCVLTHNPLTAMVEDAKKIADDHDVLDCKYVGLGMYSFKEENENTCFKHFFDIVPNAAKELNKYGKYFMYHNHDHEFQKFDGKLILDHIAEKIPAEYLGFTLDTFWVQAGGGDPAWWLEKLSGRVPVIHLKDFAYGKTMAVLGEGNINFDRVFEKAEKAGTEFMLVEQDRCNGEDPFDCLKRSYAYLKANGFN